MSLWLHVVCLPDVDASNYYYYYYGVVFDTSAFGNARLIVLMDDREIAAATATLRLRRLRL